MAKKQTNKERLKEITDSIESGIKDLFQSEKYMNYLRSMSRFHQYSTNNTLLIYSQCPHATLVAGLNKWRNQFGRDIKPGEGKNGIKIIAPSPFKKTVDEVKLDPDTKLPMRDKKGNIIMEKKEIKIPMYKPVTVFDVSQTEGEPLPSLASELKGDVQNYDVFMEALRRSSPVPLKFDQTVLNMDGYFSRANQLITIRDNMSEVQTVCATVHEIAHARLHNYKGDIDDQRWYDSIELFDKPALFTHVRVDREKIPEELYCYDLRGADANPEYPTTIENVVKVNYVGTVITAEPLELQENGLLYLNDNWNFINNEETLKHFYEEAYPERVAKNRSTEEVEAESVSFAVCAYYGIDTSENSFGYIASWSENKELPELKASLETIKKTASGLIEDIDRHYVEICKERGIDITAPTPELAQAAEQPDTDVQLDTQAQKCHASDNSAQAGLDEYPVPDKEYSSEDLAQYGVHDPDIIPVSKETAAELIERELTVYAVTYEGTYMVFDHNEVDAYSDGSVFAVLREEWEQTDDFKNAVAERMDRQQEREAAFLGYDGDCFAIYQVKLDDKSLHDLRYMPMDFLQKQGMYPTRESYELAYTAPLPENVNLDTLFQQFNIDHPADYMRPSLSVSDVIALRQDGVVSCHYVDSVGFKELSGFLQPENHLKNAEMQLEDDYNMFDGVINNGPASSQAAHPSLPAEAESSLAPQLRLSPQGHSTLRGPQSTVAELEEQVRSGQSISLLSLSEAIQREKSQTKQTDRSEKKPSVLAKLHKPLPTEYHTNKAAPEKSAERGEL